MPENLVRRGRIWYLRVQVNKRAVLKSTGFADYKSAKRRAGEIMTALLAGKAGWRGPAPTVAEWWEVYEKTYSRQKRAPRRDRQIIAPYLRAVGGRALDAINRADCVGYVNARGAAVAPGTLAREMGFLKAFFARAVDNGKIEHNPWKGLKRPVGAVRARVLEPHEQPLLMAALRLDYQRLVTVIVGSGLRVGELLALTRECVHNNRISVIDSKWGKSREIPMRPEVAAALTAQRCSRDCEHGAGCEHYWTQDPSSLRQCLAEACLRARIPHLTVHDLRRTFGTRCALAGMAPRVLMELMGHSSMEVTMKYYAHVNAGDAAAALGRVDLGLEVSDTTFDTT